MYLDLSGNNSTRTLVFATLCLAALFSLGWLGYWATPVEAGQPILLSPDRWQAQRLARVARAESESVYRDAEKLVRLLDSAAPDPVSAMLLAQGIYARQRTGTSATAPARQALIAAAEVSARYASGSLDKEEAFGATVEALGKLERLMGQ
jgi:hypothetical protein